MTSNINISKFHMIQDFVEHKFKCSAHDLNHVQRVQTICKEIAKGYDVN